MNTLPKGGELVLAAHSYTHALDDVRRYCGLSWSGGPPETWAFAYYDTIETDPDRIDPVDVVAAAALHPGIGRDDLAWFSTHRAALDAWLASVQSDAALPSQDDSTLHGLRKLAEMEGISLTLLTKVLHRKRPDLVPLLDRHVVDRYRPLTGERQPAKAWSALIDRLVEDLDLNSETLSAISNEVSSETGVALTALRVCDIAIWMGART